MLFPWQVFSRFGRVEDVYLMCDELKQSHGVSLSSIYVTILDLMNAFCFCFFFTLYYKKLYLLDNFCLCENYFHYFFSFHSSSIYFIHFEGCRFVKYSDRETALAAIDALNGIYTMRVSIIISFLIFCLLIILSKGTY